MLPLPAKLPHIYCMGDSRQDQHYTSSPMNAGMMLLDIRHCAQRFPTAGVTAAH